MNKKETISKSVAKDKILLDSWHPHVENAMQALHAKFKTNSKFILTESDLKCWLFFYLQKQEPYIKYGVHSEVTHYALHDAGKEGTETKHKFRDLSLLCPWEITANEDFIDKGASRNEILNKGFLHRAPAVHFELKFVRENSLNNQVRGFKDDLEKLNGYHPNSKSRIRDFVIVCGSRSENTKVDKLENSLAELNNEKLNNRVWIYLFDKEKLSAFKYTNGTCEPFEI